MEKKRGICDLFIGRREENENVYRIFGRSSATSREIYDTYITYIHPMACM